MSKIEKAPVLSGAAMKAGMDYVTGAEALELAGWRVIDWTVGEKSIKITFEHVETRRLKKIELRIFPGHPGSNDKGLFWSEMLGKFVTVPED